MNTPFQQLKRDYYQRVATTPSWPLPARAAASDIVLHLPVLEFLASQCRHCTEMGVRDGHSTIALLSGCPGHLVSYDIARGPIVSFLEGLDLPCQWTFHQADTADPRLDIDPTELLFLDTLHTYDHLSAELRLHARKASRFLVFHDTSTCGERDLSGPNPQARGILPAIEEFMARYPGQYRTWYRTELNNGLWVLERQSPLCC